MPSRANKDHSKRKACSSAYYTSRYAVLEGGPIVIHPLDPLSQTDLSRTINSVQVLGPQRIREPTLRVKAIKVIQRMRGGSQSRLMLGDDNNLWVVKFKNNPQHVRILANELIATRIAEAIGLSMPKAGIVDVSQSIIGTHPPLYMDHGPKRRELCLSGLQFGSQFAGGAISSHVEEYLADEQLLNANNLEQFAGVLAFDKWTGNADYRQVVYRRNGAERGYIAVFIDQGACFNLGEWTFPDAPLKGVFAQTCAYSAVRGWESFEPWLNRIEHFDPQALWEIVETVPLEWYGSKVCEVDRLVDKLISRRCRVRELIIQFKNSGAAPFPHWKRTRLVRPPRNAPPRISKGGAAIDSEIELDNHMMHLPLPTRRSGFGS
jgi:hypothetical protein